MKLKAIAEPNEFKHLTLVELAQMLEDVDSNINKLEDEHNLQIHLKADLKIAMQEKLGGVN
jgi:hypothetical protein